MNGSLAAAPFAKKIVRSMPSEFTENALEAALAPGVAVPGPRNPGRDSVPNHHADKTATGSPARPPQCGWSTRSLGRAGGPAMAGSAFYRHAEPDFWSEGAAGT